jgi:hypothetical protein
MQEAYPLICWESDSKAFSSAERILDRRNMSDFSAT